MIPRFPVSAAVLLAFLVGASGAASAAGEMDAAAAYYAAGDYLAAADAAQAAGSAEGHALAARALLAAATTGPRSGSAPLVSEAAQAARRAVAQDAGVVEGHLQLAVALGFKGRSMGNIAAHERGLARAARTAIDAALALAPDDPWVLSVDGTWHLEIVGGAGPLLGAALYDADRSRGLAALRAAAAAPDASPVVVHQCALQLMAHDPTAFGAEAARWLAAVTRREGADAFERHSIRQAGRLLRAWRSGRASLLDYEIARQQRRGT